jgi:hypothetical protein
LRSLTKDRKLALITSELEIEDSLEDDSDNELLRAIKVSLHMIEAMSSSLILFKDINSLAKDKASLFCEETAIKYFKSSKSSNSGLSISV